MTRAVLATSDTRWGDAFAAVSGAAADAGSGGDLDAADVLETAGFFALFLGGTSFTVKPLIVLMVHLAVYRGHSRRTVILSIQQGG